MTSLTDSQRLVRTREREEMVKHAASLTASVHKDAPMPRASASADSSGFVDMSAFSAADPNWIERALASARGNAPATKRPQPTPTVRGMLLAPQTLAPVAISDLVDSRASKTTPRQRRSAFVAGMVGASFVIGVAAIAVKALLPVPAAVAMIGVSEEMRGAAIAIWIAPPISTALATPTPTSTPTPTPTSTSASASTSTSTSKAPPPKSPARAQPVGPRPKPAPVGAARPAPGGTPSLEEMMRRAAQPPPAKPKK